MSQRGRAYLIDTDSLLPVEPMLLPSPSTLLLPAFHPQYDITCLPVRALVRLALEHNFLALWHTSRDLQSIMLSMVDGFVTLTVWADFLDDATSASALVTSDLRL